MASLGEEERGRIALNVNLDSVGGNSHLTALTGGFPGLKPFLLSVAQTCGHDLRCFRSFLTNSDHANFVQAGIPAFRLVAGHDDLTSHLRLVLTPGDTRDKVARAELKAAAQLAACVTATARQAEPAEAETWRK